MKKEQIGGQHNNAWAIAKQRQQHSPWATVREASGFRWLYRTIATEREGVPFGDGGGGGGGGRNIQYNNSASEMACTGVLHDISFAQATLLDDFFTNSTHLAEVILSGFIISNPTGMPPRLDRVDSLLPYISWCYVALGSIIQYVAIIPRSLVKMLSLRFLHSSMLRGYGRDSQTAFIVPESCNTRAARCCCFAVDISLSEQGCYSSSFNTSAINNS